MTEVELQPYALIRIARDIPCLHRNLGDFQPIVPLVHLTPSEFTVSLTHLKVKVRYRCPENYRDLFFRQIDHHAAPKIVKMLRDGFEDWMARKFLVRSASSTWCKCEECKLRKLAN